MARIELQGPDRATEGPNTRDETPERGWSFKRIMDSLNTMFGEIYNSLASLVDAISDAETAAAYPIVSAVIAGGAAGPLTVAGIAEGDELISVVRYVGAGVAVTDVADLTAEFAISDADEIDNTDGTATTGDKLLVLYRDKTA